MTQYKLRIKTNKYGDYRDDIYDLVMNNPGQMTFEEYDYIYNLVSERNGSNFLIFGTGKDSQLWVKANKNGKTIFLEDDIEWINHTSVIGLGLDIRHVEYSPHVGYDAERLLEEYEAGENNLTLNLDDDIRNTEWDFIIVDGPANYGFDVPCRMKSVYESYNLSNPDTNIFVHDVNKQVVKMYTDYFYKESDLIKTWGVCKCGDNPLCRCNLLKHFKKREE